MTETISFPNLNLSFEINKTAFSVGGFEVRWYGVLIGLGMLAAIIYALFAVKKTKLSQDDLLNMTIIGLPCAIIGARAYYVIFNWSAYKGDLSQIFAIRNGGLAIYGGIIAAALAVIIYCKIKKINVGIPFDLLAVGLPMAQAIGRWGNFVNGEAYGRETNLPWAMSIGEYVNMVHPTFLYESLWNIIGVIIVLIYKRFKKFDGEQFCIYMIWYGIGRFWIEGLRTDSLYLGVFRISQLVASLSVAAGIAIILWKRFYKKSEAK